MTFKLGYCHCGCGTSIPILSQHRAILRRFVYGHYRRGRHFPNEDYNNRSGKNNVRWKGGRFLSTSGYMCITVGKIRRYEHRHIVEKHLGRKLFKTELVHHINGIKTDNRIENLELIDGIKSHNRIHTEQDREEKSNRLCLECKRKTLLRRHIRQRQNGTIYYNSIYDWYRHPITKQEWVCRQCYRKIKKAMTN